jgi:hypothetical protein
MFIRMFQALMISIAFGGWIIYQLFIRKKKFMEISNDVIAIVFFIGVWLGIYYWLMN